MKLSNYNIIFERNGEYFLYNSLSNSFALLDRETYLYLNSHHATEVNIEDKELYDILFSMKAVDVDKDYELMRLRYIDDYRRFNRSRVSLTIVPTLACNFRCPYCFEVEHQNRFMTDEIEDRIVDYVAAQTQASVIDITWFGGEPLMAFPRIETLTARLKNLGKTYRAGMISNGYLLTEEVAGKLEDLSIGRIQITLDGPKEIHDSRRFLKGGYPTFDHIVENIERCSVIAPSVRIIVRVNLDLTNRERYLELYELLREKKLKNLQVYPAFVSDINRDNPCAICSEKDRIDYLVNLYKEHNLDYVHLYPSHERTTCMARNMSSMVVGPDGEMYKCWNDVGIKEREVGSIGDKITNKGLWLQYVSGALQWDDSECANCRLLPVCNGGCPYTRIRNKYHGENKNNCILHKNNLEDFLYLHYRTNENLSINQK